MATITDGRYWLTTLVTLTLMATTLVVPQAGSDPSLEVRGAAYATSSGRDPLAISVPEATEAGDLLVAIVAVTASSATAPGQDWDLVRSDSRGGQLTQAMWMRRATEGEPTVHKWSGGNRPTSQSGAIITVGVSGGGEVGELRMTNVGAAAHRLDPIVLPSLHADRDGALLLGGFSLIGEGELLLPAEMTGSQASISGAITLATGHEILQAGSTGERVVKRETDGGAAGQLLLVELIGTETEPVEDPDSEEAIDAGNGESANQDGNEELPGEPDDSEPIDDGSAGSDGDHHHDHTDDGSHGDHGSGGEDVAHGQMRWLDPAAWPDGTVPTSRDDVVIKGHMVIDGNASARTVTVTPGSKLEFAPDTSAQLQAFGNVVVEGTLKMQPSGYDIDHALRFFGIDEEAYVGGGHAVLESDTGLWITGHGHVMLHGSERLPWTRAATSLSSGSTTVLLEDPPTGWQLGDVLLITPTAPPGTPGHSDGYSQSPIRSIDGKTIVLDTPLAYSHPRVNGQWGAEVMNMTRNVRIEGTPGGRAHVMFAHGHSAQHLENVALRHMGPRQDTDATYRSGSEQVPITAGVMGRYPIHFHHMGDGSRGSTVTNVVVQDSGHRAFVAHASNGIDFVGTIAHDVFDTAYWWDTTEGCCRASDMYFHPPVLDVSYSRTIASLIRTDPPFRGFRLAGYELGYGENLSITDSVAVGVQGNANAAGFNWPEAWHPESPGFWTFERNIAHNNRMQGIFTWQNTSDPRHVISDSVLYHNGQYGIDHGAYFNRYRYDGIELFGNGESGVNLHAQGGFSLSRLTIDGAGVSRYALRTTLHNATASGAQIEDSRFRGFTDRAIAFLSPTAVHLDIVNPVIEGGEGQWFHLADHVPEDSVIRVQLKDGTAFRLHPRSSGVGTLVPEWNARREAIQPFA